MRSKYIYYFIFLVFVYLFLTISIYRNINYEESKSTKNLNEKPIKSEQDESSEEKFCEKNGDWLSFGHEVFFKKSAAYYFQDLNFVYLNFLNRGLLSAAVDLKFSLAISQERRVSLENPQLFELYYFESLYTAYTIKLDFVLDKHLLAPDIRLDLFISDSKNSSLPEPLVLKMKNSSLFQAKIPFYFDQDKKKSSSQTFICAKVLFMQDEETDLKNLQSWAKINSKLGFDKIVVFNLPEVRQLTCLPNLLSSGASSQETRFFRNYSSAIAAQKNPSQLYKSVDWVSYILINECYLDFFDQYKYVMVLDTDEVLMSMMDHETDFEMLHNELETNQKTERFHVDKQLQSIRDLSSRIQETFQDSKTGEIYQVGTIYCTYATFLRNSQFNKLCEAFEKHKTNDIFFFRDDFDRSTTQNLSILIDPTKKHELDYTRLLCDLNARVVKQLPRRFEPDHEAIFNRFFAFYTYAGKSISNTSRIFSVGTHAGRINYECRKAGDGKCEHGAVLYLVKNTDLVYPPHSRCYIGHFRKNPIVTNKQINISISDFYFDSIFVKLFEKDFN